MDVVIAIDRLRGLLPEHDIAELRELADTGSPDSLTFNANTEGFQTLLILLRAEGRPLTKRVFEIRGEPETFLQKLSVLFIGPGVSTERRRKRVLVCLQCPYMRGKPEPYECGVCKCRISGDRRLLKLARHEERRGRGCNHPDGSWWKKAKV